MIPPPIPAKLDLEEILRNLNEWGFKDYKIEMACGWGEGYVSHLKAGRIISVRFESGARLFNLWRDELAANLETPQALEATSTT